MLGMSSVATEEATYEITGGRLPSSGHLSKYAA